MKNSLLSILFTVLSLIACTGALPGQASACPQVTVAPAGPVCPGNCVNLSATVQGSVATTSYTVSSIPYSPYSYSGGNPVLINIDDTWSGAVPIPFCFQFFGNTYNQLLIGSNAIVTFDLSQANGYCQWPINAAIPSNTNPRNSIMAPFHDIDPSVGTPTSATDINWQVVGTAPCREFIVSWNDVAMFSCTNLIASSQMVLHETTNIIDIYIQNKPLCSSWNNGAAIEGIQNAAGTVAYVVAGRNYPTQWTAANDGRRFMPAGAPQYTLNWTGPSGSLGNANPITVCPTTTTTYTCTVTNNTCAGPVVVSASQTVVVTAGLTTAGSQTNATTCNPCDGSATITVSSGTGPFTYAWQPSGGNAATATALCPGTYTGTVTDASGCTGTQVFTINGPPPVTSTQSTTAVSCNGGCDGTATIVAIPPGTYTYSWTPNVSNTATATGLCAGTYTVTATNQGGCATTQTIVVTEPSPVTATTTTTPSDCISNTGTASVTASGGVGPYTYAWNTTPVQTTTTAVNLGAGSYQVTVTDANGCSYTAVAIVNNQTTLNASTTVSNLSCFTSNDGAILVNVTGGNTPYAYSWNPTVGTGNTAVSLAAGTYMVDVTDGAGCVISLTATVTQPADLAVGASANPNVICAGSTTQLAAAVTGGTPGYTYSWQPGAFTANPQNVTPNTTTTYSVYVTDANDCIDSSTVQVIVHPNPVVSFFGDQLSGCAPLCVRFTDQSTISSGTIVSGTWDFGDGSPLALLPDSAHCYASGVYSVTLNVISSEGCSSSLTLPSYIDAFVIPVANFNANPQPATLQEPLITFTDLSTNSVTWSWNFGDTTDATSFLQHPSFTYTEEDCYDVMLAVTSSNGCVDTTIKEVCILPEITLYVPNAFTPNGDGINDVFIPVYQSLDPQHYEMWIFDRWGNMVFHTTDIYKGWDGRMKNNEEPVQNDTYVWKIRVTDLLGVKHGREGIVNLVR